MLGIVKIYLVRMKLSMSKRYDTFVSAWAWRGKTTVLALLVGFIASCNEKTLKEPNVVVVSPTTQASAALNVKNNTAALTDAVMFFTTPDKQSLANRRVQFMDVKVHSVVSDRSFWVGPSNIQKVFVVLDEALDSGRAEKNINIKMGQTLALNGLIRTLPSMDEAQKQWSLSAIETSALKNQKVYLQAEKVELLFPD